MVKRIKTYSHHVLWIKHLSSELWDGEGTVSLRRSACQWSESDHEKVQTWKWNHVHCQFTQIRIQLTRETQTGGHTRHDSRDQVIQVTVGWSGELESTEANVIQSFIVNAESFIRVLNQLVDGKSCIVRLDNSVRDLFIIITVLDGRWQGNKN